jgi:7,8-dihydropterin-6-yl-methyl-4-(beta-D-ribofuranosyl)aminobenzene 5'-phosphate synthase
MDPSPYFQCDSVSLSLLVENTARGAGILGEHGLCWCLRHGGQQILFDLGQGMALHRNAKRMGVDLEDTDALVFSHGHYDHVGGWGTFSDRLSHAKVYLHPDALTAKFQRRRDGRMVPAGVATFAGAVVSAGNEVIASTEPREVSPGIWMTGEVPRTNQVEDTGGDFYCGKQGADVDLVLDDQSLFFKTELGVVVVLGCAHAGVVNTLDYISALTGERIHAVLGGMHLLHANPQRMQFTIDGLRRLAPEWLAPNHCTGDAAVAALRAAFPDKVFEIHAGQSCIFPRIKPTPEASHGTTL